MKLIVAVDRNWAIGKDDDFLVKIPEDMKRIRMLTMGNVVIMGRKTLVSLPDKRPLLNRTNIVLTRNNNLKKEYEKYDNLIVVNSIDELKSVLKVYEDKDIFVIGGESVYKELLPMCNEALVTKIDFSYDANKYFPNLDKAPDWKITSISEENTYYDIIFEYVIYNRK